MARSDLQKHTLNLRTGDYDYLSRFYHSRGVTAADVIRSIISQHVDALQKMEPPTKVDLPDDL